MNAQTKRGLLELAAKAGGVAVDWREWAVGRVDKFGCLKSTKKSGFRMGGRGWDPLDDDGDALRLAVKLGFIVDTHGAFTRISLPFGDVMCIAAHGDDPCAATRLAIVRAAAKIAIAAGGEQ